MCNSNGSKWSWASNCCLACKRTHLQVSCILVQFLLQLLVELLLLADHVLLTGRDLVFQLDFAHVAAQVVLQLLDYLIALTERYEVGR